MQTRELKRKLKEYFGNTPNTVIFAGRRKQPAVYIEYEDFRSEPRVASEIRQLTGEGVSVIVKRECSESLMRRIDRLLCGNREDLRMHLMETVE